jgi:NAD(P)-dependent dehydrogenase (short-subunit alcohol dehydrogenase family)
MDLQLSGKLALVTGSTAGIGLAIGSVLAGEGATVIINGRSGKRVAEATEEIRQKHPYSKLEALIGDLSKGEAVGQATSSFPHVDILVNNLGLYEPKPFEAISDEDWTAIIETNFMSGVRLSRHYLPKMKARNWGRIIFISSESAINILVEMIHYGVTKTMQLALARGLAETTAGTGVTVNSILAGPTRSEGVEEFVSHMAKSRNVEPSVVEKEFFETVHPSSLLKRFATTDEVAALIAYVASPQSSATNGAALRVDGGVIRSINWSIPWRRCFHDVRARVATAGNGKRSHGHHRDGRFRIGQNGHRTSAGGRSTNPNTIVLLADCLEHCLRSRNPG